MNKTRGIFGYMCLTDFEHEMGNHDVIVCLTKEKLREARRCVDGCGIMKVGLRTTPHESTLANMRGYIHITPEMDEAGDVEGITVVQEPT